MEKSENRTRKMLFTVKDIGLIALLTATCVVGRTAFQFIPNVQPMTAIFIVITLHKGFYRGFTVAVLSVLVTNIYMGMGVWTISQLVSYGGIVILAAFLGKNRFFSTQPKLQILFACFAGFLFGFLTACVDKQIYGFQAFLPYYLQGLPFDTLHAVGNGVFYLLLSPILTKLFERFWRD